ncbi:hypothetical protein [Chromohalobacter sp. 296-RDG]|uniref:hypothetical protein n=1 Tax=Chromohalobacter sp. 296-RDG TaxID=2994062 RepID=UPI0024697436|nr:hypothetical protein [Chromohalobacter sp. 296-RDG]
MESVELKLKAVTRFVLTRRSSAPGHHVDELGEFLNHERGSHAGYAFKALTEAEGKPAWFECSDDRMAHLSDIDLLAELIRRKGPGGATPHKRRIGIPHRDVCIGIGKDHAADITMEEDALAELHRRAGIGEV